MKKQSRRVDEYVKAKDIHSFDMMMFLVVFDFILKDLSPKLKSLVTNLKLYAPNPKRKGSFFQHSFFPRVLPVSFGEGFFC